MAQSVRPAQDTRSWYDNNVDAYIRRTHSFETFPGLEGDLLEFISRLRRGGTVADLGSGSGRDAELISAADHQVLAIDISEPLLRQCLINNELGPVTGILADLKQLPLAKGRLAGIWACASLLHLERQELTECIATCADALMPGGWLGISMKEGVGHEVIDGRLFTFITVDELRGLLERARLHVDVIKGPDRGNWLLALAQHAG